MDCGIYKLYYTSFLLFVINKCLSQLSIVLAALSLKPSNTSSTSNSSCLLSQVITPHYMLDLVTYAQFHRWMKKNGNSKISGEKKKTLNLESYEQ